MLKQTSRKLIAYVTNRLIRALGNRQFPMLTSLEWKGVQSHFSQCGEDLIIEKVWNHYFEGAIGTYLDVGAFHPINYSNTWNLYKKGWRGINIDANAQAIERFNQIRPEDKNLCAAIGKEGVELLYCSYRSPATNRLITQGEATINFFGEEPKSITPVQCRSLTTILNDSLSPENTIDLMTLDCEGHETEILQALDWNRYRPKLIALECSHESKKLHSFLIEKGYLFISMSPPTHFFILKTAFESNEG